MRPEEARLFGRTLGAIAHRLDALTTEEIEHLREVPVRRAIDVLDAYEPWREFDHVNPELEAVDGHVRMLGESEWAGRYWQLVLLHLVVRTLQGDHRFVIPPSVSELLLADLARIVEQTETGQSVEDPLGNDDFLLDLALSRGVALPFDSCIAALVWLAEGVSVDLTPGLWLHLHFRDIAAIGFTPDVINWSAPYLLNFIDANPECRGWFSVTWLIDPNLDEVSPHLTWYREVVVAAGARMSAAGTDEQTVSDATSTSNTRRSKFEQGSYQPCDYRMVFHRDVAMQWYERTAHLLPPPKRPDPRATLVPPIYSSPWTPIGTG